MKSFQVQVVVEHDKAHAWEFFFNQTNGWWSETMYTSEKTERFTIDTYIGGKAYEDFGEGSGLIWGEVIGVDYTNWLEMRGNLTREFGGPAITFERFEFVQDSYGHTTITYTLDLIGEASDKSVSSLKKGWEDILNNHYRPYCKDRR